MSVQRAIDEAPAADGAIDGGAASRHDDGATMHAWASDLFPLNRSLTGPGVRATLAYLERLLPGLQLHSVPSGAVVFDWIVPDEWVLRDAYVEDERGERLIDVQRHTLHVLGYSTPVDAWMSIAELDAHLHALPDQPHVIPYVTSYYQRRWGFCLSDVQRRELLQRPDERVHVVIDATLAPGRLDYADLVIQGDSDEEILFSTNVCHPSMANNELSGPVVQTALARWIASRSNRRYSYRFAFIPETIGALVYLERHLEHLRARVRAGYVLSCVGDERTFSYLASRRGDTLADRAARVVLDAIGEPYVCYAYLDRGSDERQYCSPSVDLPVCSVTRSMHGHYPEYHTSADDLQLVTASGLSQSLHVYQRIVTVLEANRRYESTTVGEPQLGRRGLYPTLSTLMTRQRVRRLMNLIAYADGERDLIDIATTIGEDPFDLVPLADTLVHHGLLRVYD